MGLYKMVSDAKYQLMEPHPKLTTLKPWGEVCNLYS